MFKRLFQFVSKASYSYRNFSSFQAVLERYNVKILPALKDNYMYLLIDRKLNSAIAVDPVEPDNIIKVIEKENIILKAVLTTHHHYDHAGGNEIISNQMKNIPIFGGDERIAALTDKLKHNDVLKIEDMCIKCLHTPCHTLGHMCYFIGLDNPICFTGDTLFVGGCGRFFEGSAEQMLMSLNILSTLPLNTKIYCGHEYTLSNLKFALSVEPNNLAILKALEVAKSKILNSKPTVPSTIGDELSYNPFFRVQEKTVQDFTRQSNPVAVMQSLRITKDNFTT